MAKARRKGKTVRKHTKKARGSARGGKGGARRAAPKGAVMARGPKITPFLWFDGNAEEAVEFYTSVFKGSRVLSTSRYGEHGPGPKGSVMTIAFEIAGQRFTALNGGPDFKFNESVSFVVHCDDQAEVDYYWERLTSGGGSPLQCGWLKDRFGLWWQVIPTVLFDLIDAKDPARSERVMREVMQMIKPDIARLKAAAAGRS